MDIPRDHYIRICIILVLLLAPIVAANAQPFEQQEVIEEDFTVAPGQTLRLASDLGSVKVISGSGNRLVVRVTKGIRNGSSSQAQEYFNRFDVRMRQTSRGIEVEGTYDRPSVRQRRNALQVVYEIQVPHTFNVDLITAGGSVNVAGLNGNARMKTSGGAIGVSNIEGTVTAQTSGGSVTAEEIVGGTTLETSGGSITVRDMRGAVKLETSGGSIMADGVDGDLYAHTSGGSVKLARLRGAADASTSGGSIMAEILGQPKGELALSTSGGSVTVHLDDGIRASIVADASGGRVRSELPITGRIERTHVRGDLNGGGPELNLRSSGGSVNILGR